MIRHFEFSQPGDHYDFVDTDGEAVRPGSAVDLTGLAASPEEVSMLDQVMAEAEAEHRRADELDFASTITEPALAMEFARMSHAERQNVIELANDLSGSGYEIDLAAQMVDESEAYSGLVDLANEQASRNSSLVDREVTRIVQNHQPLPRSASTEDRLARAYDRISAGTFVPSGALDFSGTADVLPGQVTGAPICGPADPEFGYCMSVCHDAGCGSSADPFIAVELQASGVYSRMAAEPFLDSRGQAWRNGAGELATLTDHLEAASGQRLRPGLFEPGRTGRPELASIPSRVTFGDPDDPDDTGRPVPARTSRAVASLAEQAGLAVRSADEIRESARRQVSAATA